MCGACGEHSIKDWSWPWLVGRRSAHLIARSAERLSRVRGVKVLPMSNGWQILMPTGSTHLIQSLGELVRIAKIDPCAPPEVLLDKSSEVFPLDHRRAITVKLASSSEPTSSTEDTWPSCLLNTGFSSVTVNGLSADRCVLELKNLACIASMAPYRDHIRLLPIAIGSEPLLIPNCWDDLPDRIGSTDLPAFCLSMAARLTALPEADLEFRETRIHCNDLGMMRLQSVGSTVTAFEIDQK